jgi:hypothetical protein
MTLLHDHECNGWLVAGIDLRTCRAQFIHLVAEHERELALGHTVTEEHESLRVDFVSFEELIEKTERHLVQVVYHFVCLAFWMLLSVKPSS